MKKENGKGKPDERFSLGSDGTIDRTYHITGSGESYYTNKEEHPPIGQNGFSQGVFEGALRRASRRTSALGSRKTGT